MEARLGADRVAEVVHRYESGESATSIAKRIDVAPSALLRLLREQNVVVRKHGLTPEQDAMLAMEYKAGATMADLEKKHQFSHEAVYRAWRRMKAAIRLTADALEHVIRNELSTSDGRHHGIPIS